MISINLRILLVVFSFLLSVFTILLIRNGSLPVKYSLFWIMSAIMILLMGVFPKQIGAVTRLVGFEVASNFVTGVLLVILLLISLILTLIVSKQKKTLILLIQEVSILKKTVKDDDK